MIYRRDANRWVFGGVRVRGDRTLWSLIFAQRVGPIWGRIGFVESQAAVGAEWRPLSAVTVRGDLVDVARSWRSGERWRTPRLDAEIVVRPMRPFAVVFGARDLLQENRAFLIGVRAGDIP